MLQSFRALAVLLLPALTASALILPAPALAADSAPAMILNVAVDVTGVTGDKGDVTIVCHVSEHDKVKDNALDGRAKLTLLHDNVNGAYVARYQGPVRVEMIRSPAARYYDFSKLDTYYCSMGLTADGLTTSPSITGPLPKTPTPVAGGIVDTVTRGNTIVKRGLLAPSNP